MGTNYSRVIPSKEINSKDRDSFWKKEEEEERIRIETERGRQVNAKRELEKVYFLRLMFFNNSSHKIIDGNWFKKNWLHSSNIYL